MCFLLLSDTIKTKQKRNPADFTHARQVRGVGLVLAEVRATTATTMMILQVCPVFYPIISTTLETHTHGRPLPIDYSNRRAPFVTLLCRAGDDGTHCVHWRALPGSEFHHRQKPKRVPSLYLIYPLFFFFAANAHFLD